MNAKRKRPPPAKAAREAADTLGRVAERPLAAEWAADEPMTLKEYVAVFWPAGPLTLSSLRREIARGALAHSRFANRIFVTPASVADVMRPSRPAHRTRAQPATLQPAAGAERGQALKERSERARRDLEEALERLSPRRP